MKSITRALIAVAANGNKRRVKALTLRILEGASQRVAAERAGVSRGVLVRLEQRLKKAGSVEGIEGSRDQGIEKKGGG